MSVQLHSTVCPLLTITVVQIIKVLGEGGFSFVYLAQDEHSGVSSGAFGKRVGALTQKFCSGNLP